VRFLINYHYKIDLNINHHKCVIMVKKTINDYTFYKIVNVNGDVDLCYVGSTVNMGRRTRTHKSDCNNPNSIKHNLKVYKTIREHGGWDEFKMIPIGTAEQLKSTEAHVIEEKYRIELSAEMNSCKCFRTSEEDKEHRRLYYENNKEASAKRSKMRYENNKEYIAQYSKVYRENNKETIAEKAKVYYENNKEVVNEVSKVYRENNKDRLYAKITCECGCESTRSNLTKHRKTKRHIDLMNNKNNIHVIHNE